MSSLVSNKSPNYGSIQNNDDVVIEINTSAKSERYSTCCDTVTARKIAYACAALFSLELSGLYAYLAIPMIIAEKTTSGKIIDSTLVVALVALPVFLAASWIMYHKHKVQEEINKEQEKIRIHGECLKINPNYDFFSAAAPEIHEGKRIIFQDEYRPKIQEMISKFRDDEHWNRYLWTYVKYHYLSGETTDEALINLFQRKLKGGTCFGQANTLIDLMIDSWNDDSVTLMKNFDIDKIVFRQLAQTIYHYDWKIADIHASVETVRLGDLKATLQAVRSQEIILKNISTAQSSNIQEHDLQNSSHTQKIEKIEKDLKFLAAHKVSLSYQNRELTSAVRDLCKTHQLFSCVYLEGNSFNTSTELRRYLTIENATSHPMGTIGYFKHYDSQNKFSSGHGTFFQISENHYRYYDSSATPAGMYDFPDEQTFFDGLWKHLNHSHLLKEFKKHQATIYLPNYLPKPATMDAEDV